MPNAPVPDRATVLDSDTSATSDLYAAAIGAIGTDYYQKAFAALEGDTQARAGWNWAAGLITLNWMVYRQMWGAALAYVGAMIAAVLLITGIGRLIFQFSNGTEWALLAALVLLSVVIPALMGNAWMYRATSKKVEAALAANTTLPEAAAMLRAQAITRRRAYVLGAANVLVVGLLLTVYLNFPSVATLPLESSKMVQARTQSGGKTADLTNLPQANKTAEPAKVEPVAGNAAPKANAAPATSATPSATGPSASGSVATATPAPVATAAPAAMTVTPPAQTLSASPAHAAATTVANAPATPPASTVSPSPTNATVAPSPANITTVPLGKAASNNAAEKRAGSKAPPEPITTAVKPLAAAAPTSTKAANARSPDPADKAPAATAVKPTKTAAPAKATAPASANASAPAMGTSEAAPSAPSSTSRAPQFLVNVGLFADPNNARNAYTKLMDASLPATSVEFNTSKGKRTRVRVGPFETQAEADRAMEKVRSLGLEAEPVRQP